MSDETNLVPNEVEIDSTYEAYDMVELTFDKFLDTATVDMVFGDPVEHGDTLIIPCSEAIAILGVGAGYGYGKGPDVEGEEGGGEPKNTGEGGGGGGGGWGRSFARPVAVVISSSEGVRVEPVVDATKIALGALTAAGFMAGMVFKMLKSPKRSLNDM
jgi:uncharacterized spore protein YtfJ